MVGNEPVLKVQQGQMSAAAWSRKVERDNGASFEQLSVKIEKRYRDADGNWKSSTSYTPTELLRLQHFVGRVIDKVYAHQEANKAGEAA